jgi:hypothetical protein
MLINSIREAYREMTGQIVQAESLNTVPSHRPAANDGRFSGEGIQARRHRRQRRLDRVMSRNISGWTVRTWFWTVQPTLNRHLPIYQPGGPDFP